MLDWKKVSAKLKEGKYVLCVFLLGALLLMLPKCTKETEAKTKESPEEITPPVFDLSEQEDRLSEAISSIAGAGRAQVVLSVRGSVSRELASEAGETLIVSTGSGTQAPVELRYIFPEYQGALVLCEGAENPAVRLAVTEAVRAVTGLGADKITVVHLA